MKRPTPKKVDCAADAAQCESSWTQGVLLPSLCSAVLLQLAFPPSGLYPLAWIAPIGWLLVCRRPQAVGYAGYWALWLSGCLFWLVAVHSVRLAFWALYFGWLAMSAYLAIYIPLMVGITRLLVHRWRVPLVLAAPVVWTGCETWRSHLFSGYAANSLAHSQAMQPLIIQMVDQVGTGGLSFCMVMFAAGLLEFAQRLLARRWCHSLVPAMIAGSLLMAIAGYGRWRLHQADSLALQPPVLRCLLLQENTPSIFEMSPDFDEYVARARRSWDKYALLCQQAVAERSAGGPFALDLVVWPESTFTALSPLVRWELDGDDMPPALRSDLQAQGLDRQDLEDHVSQMRRGFDVQVQKALLASRGVDPNALPADPSTASTEKNLPAPDLLVGCDYIRYSPDDVRRFNAAVWLGADGAVADVYSKMHLVMFGEYIPLRPLLGWLEGMFSFASLQAGDQPKSFSIGDAQVAPNICFESMMPHVIGRQLRQLAGQNASPDVLVNLTNDSWFKGSSMLDHHLAGSILCAVENRRPILVAANTGLSAEIDGSGRLLQCSERLTASTILAEPRRDGRWGLVQSVGYPLSWACAVLVACAALTLLKRQRSAK
ncbi:MAG: hypothetical protein KF752_03030 [Pirellulaceae bacterium]|nr:hypothetical protein [Pirellulaceae bacterium]